MKEIAPEITSANGLQEAARCLKSLAHPHRLRMIQLLLRGDYTVGELAQACGIPNHMASEHLGKLRDRGFLTPERSGRELRYRVAGSHLARIMDCIEARYK